jgi:hypothetical protein
LHRYLSLASIQNPEKAPVHGNGVYFSQEDSVFTDTGHSLPAELNAA